MAICASPCPFGTLTTYTLTLHPIDADYANDENGIRHGGVEPGQVDSALAKFFWFRVRYLSII